MAQKTNARAPRQETPAHKRFDLDEVIEHGSTPMRFALSAVVVMAVWAFFYAASFAYVAVTS